MKCCLGMFFFAIIFLKSLALNGSLPELSFFLIDNCISLKGLFISPFVPPNDRLM